MWVVSLCVVQGEHLDAKIGRELVKSFVDVFVRLLLIWSSSLDPAVGRKYFDIVSPKSIWNVHIFSKYLISQILQLKCLETWLT